MKKFIYTIAFFVALFAGIKNALAWDNVPFTYNGHDYVNEVSVYNPLEQNTQYLYFIPNAIRYLVSDGQTMQLTSIGSPMAYPLSADSTTFGGVMDYIQFTSEYLDTLGSDCFSSIITTMDIMWDDYYGLTDACGNVHTDHEIVVEANMITQGELPDIPEILAISPSSVEKEGGTPITLQGVNFTADATVEMCGDTADIISASEIEIVFLSTSAIYSQCSITVTANGLTAESFIPISDGQPIPPSGDDTTLLYNEMPSFVESPTEWISALLHNTGLWIGFEFTPRGQFLIYNVELLKYNMGVAFPAYADIKETIENGNATLTDGQNGLVIPDINLFGSGDIPIINTAPINDYIPQIKEWIVIFLWFYAGVYAFKTIYHFFDPIDVKVNL